MRTPLLSLLACALLVLAACQSDAPVAIATEVEDDAVEPTNTPTTRATQSTQAAEGSFEMSGVEGFNYLTDCDSLLVSRLELADPAAGGNFAYLLGSCVTNKSYDVVAVPRAGHEAAADFTSEQQVLAKAQANDFADYLVYAFQVPKVVRVDLSQVANIFPANVIVHRFEGSRWVRLGVEGVDDAAAYDAFRWRILHDEMPKFD